MTLEMSCMHNQNQRWTMTKGQTTHLIEVVKVRRLDFEGSDGNIIPARGQ